MRCHVMGNFSALGYKYLEPNCVQSNFPLRTKMLSGKHLRSTARSPAISQALLRTENRLSLPPLQRGFSGVFAGSLVGAQEFQEYISQPIRLSEDFCGLPFPHSAATDTSEKLMKSENPTITDKGEVLRTTGNSGVYTNFRNLAV